MLTTIIVFIAILALLVLAHEWGHFFTARRLGVAVQEFGFGFPPRAWSTLRGGVRYSVNWLPLGGFVKLKGEGGEYKGEPDSFAAQAPWRRSIILTAGVTMNVILAALLLSLGFVVGLPTVLDETQLSSARDVKIQVISVVPSSPAAVAGFEPGDTIMAINKQSFVTLTELQNYVAAHAVGSLVVTLERADQIIDKALTPTLLPATGARAVMGVSLVQSGIISYPWPQAVIRGVEQTWYLAREIVLAFIDLFRNLLVHQQVPKDIAGPVGIAVLTGQVVELGFIYVLQFAALLSLNLAIINILPFPALDGGRLLFVIIAKLRRKPNNEQIEALVHNIGFALLMLLVLVVTYRDVLRFGGGFISSFSKLWGS
ncbi:MAG: RIP metalloprotease RseP [Candidatus Kerfeldbacteria bacterium]|nr:RIP metalloprotease RseP [Candidatus Kerfeldbacteria bacterium]